MLTRLLIRLSLGIALCLALASAFSVPNGVDAARTIAAADDPVRLSELALDRHFNATVATREIEQALAAGDVELARSFVDLAAERGITVTPALIEKIEGTERDAATPSSRAASFARGFVTGKPEDVASAAGMLTGDLFVFGDLRDVVREGWNGLARRSGRQGRARACRDRDRCDGRAVRHGWPGRAGACRSLGGEGGAPRRIHRRAAGAAAQGGDARRTDALRRQPRKSAVESRPARRPRRIEGGRTSEGRGEARAPCRRQRARRRAPSSSCSVVAPSCSPARCSISRYGSSGRCSICLAFCAACKRAVERMTLRHCERRRIGG